MNDEVKAAEVARLKQESAQILAEIEKLEGKPEWSIDDSVSPGTGLVLMLPIDLLRAVVMADMWTWFAMPFGAPTVGVFHMAGVLLVWHVMRRTVRGSNKRDLTRFDLSYHVFESLLAWGIGALYHWAM